MSQGPDSNKTFNSLKKNYLNLRFDYVTKMYLILTKDWSGMTII